MKKALLCIIMTCLIVASLQGCKPTHDIITDQNTNITNESVLEDTQEKYNQVLDDYTQLVNDLLSENFEDKVNGGNFEAPSTAFDQDWFYMVIDAKKGITNISSSSFGYALYDLDQDGCDELVLMRDDYFILAIFTSSSENAELLGAFYYKNKGIILGDGNVYNIVTDAANIIEYNILQLKNGELSTIRGFGLNGEQYYSKTYNETKQITESEFNDLRSNYPDISDQSKIKEYMISNGIKFIPLG